MIVYLDTSTVLRVIFSQGRPLAEWGKWKQAYSSELFGVEARRVIERMRLAGALDDDRVIEAQHALRIAESGIGRIRLNRAVLRRASQPMGTIVGTLDAIHIASALLFQERRGVKIFFATHDAQQARGAQALSLECIGV